VALTFSPPRPLSSSRLSPILVRTEARGSDPLKDTPPKPPLPLPPSKLKLEFSLPPAKMLLPPKPMPALLLLGLEEVVPRASPLLPPTTPDTSENVALLFKLGEDSSMWKFFPSRVRKPSRITVPIDPELYLNERESVRAPELGSTYNMLAWTGDANDVRPTVATSMEPNRKRITGSPIKEIECDATPKMADR